MTSNEPNKTILREEDIEDLIAQVLAGKGFNVQKVARKTFLQLGQTFIEEALDLPAHQKQAPSIKALNRQINMKFPEIAREDPNIQISQRRNMQTQKEELL